MIEKSRCSWAGTDLMLTYHDHEWGQPTTDKYELFEMLSLEMMQAGLSWQTILNKREHFREAFDDFDYILIAKYNEVKIAELLNNAGIVRNKMKINAIINNARLATELDQQGGFDQFIFKLAKSHPEDEAKNTKHMLKIMKKFGFKFIGQTTLISFLETIGIYNHHEINCFLAS